MMRASICLFAVTVLASGCATLPDPLGSDELAGDYAKIAACYYERESQINATGLQFADLRAIKTIVVSRSMSDMIAGNIALTEVRLKEAAPDRTIATIKVFPSLFGAAETRELIKSRLQGC